MKPRVHEACLQLAARSLRRQVRQLTRQIPGIRQAEDLEFVHRARVASRRLRAALRVFGDCFPAGRVESWCREVRRVGRGLGQARDLDVQIEFLRDVLARLPDRACGPGIARALVQCERKRERLQPAVLKATRRLMASGVLEQMLVASDWLLPDDGAAPAAPCAPLLEHAEKHVLGRLDELLGLGHCLAEPQNAPQHHAMRIAAKRLRYTIEVYKPACAGLLDEPIEVLKQLQTLLGEVHDCDVWVEKLGRLLRKEAKRVRSLYESAGPLLALKVGIEYLQAECRRRRQEAFRQLAESWDRLEREGYWAGLVRVVQRRGIPAPVVPGGDGEHAVAGARPKEQQDPGAFTLPWKPARN
jgi:CHAD domain-containing protein